MYLIHYPVWQIIKNQFYGQLRETGNDGNAGDKAVSYTSLRDILAYDWCITAGDSRIDPEDFLALKKQYGSFIRYKDLFFEVDDRQLGALVRSLEKAPVLSPMDLLKTGLTGTFNGVPGEMTDETRRMFDAFLTPQETPVPENLQADRDRMRGLAKLCFDLGTFFIGPSEGFCRDLIHLHEETPADLLVCDSFLMAGAWWSECTEAVLPHWQV